MFRKSKKVLEATYFDVVDIYRNTESEDEWGITSHERVKVYRDIPCGLSQLRNHVSSKQTATTNNMSEFFQMFLDPMLDIKEGDEFIVTTQMGKTFKLIGGIPFVYTTHQEVIGTMDGEA